MGSIDAKCIAVFSNWSSMLMKCHTFKQLFSGSQHFLPLGMYDFFSGNSRKNQRPRMSESINPRNLCILGLLQSFQTPWFTNLTVWDWTYKIMIIRKRPDSWIPPYLVNFCWGGPPFLAAIHNVFFVKSQYYQLTEHRLIYLKENQLYHPQKLTVWIHWGGAFCLSISIYSKFFLVVQMVWKYNMKVSRDIWISWAFFMILHFRQFFD